MIAEGELARARPILRHRFRVVAQHRIFEAIENLVPGIEFHVVRVHVDDEVVVEMIARDVAARVREDFARVGARGDLLHRVFGCGASSRSESWLCPWIYPFNKCTTIGTGAPHRRSAAPLGAVRENQSAGRRDSGDARAGARRPSPSPRSSKPSRRSQERQGLLAPRLRPSRRRALPHQSRGSSRPRAAHSRFDPRRSFAPPARGVRGEARTISRPLQGVT